MSLKKTSSAVAAVSLALLVCVAGRVVKFSYIGCFVDYTGTVRDMRGLSGVTGIKGLPVQDNFVNSAALTLELCSSLCSLGNFPYFGVQCRYACFCGKTYGSQGAASESSCNTRCNGNPGQICGGVGLNSVYAVSYQDMNIFTRTAWPSQTVARPSQSTVTTMVENSKFKCLSRCEANSDCSAVIFSKEQRLCHLLRFALPPSDKSNAFGDFYVRG